MTTKNTANGIPKNVIANDNNSINTAVCGNSD
jgi:hypothetical protein